MIYKNIVEARFLSRPNRFIAHCETGGKEVAAHVRNTERLFIWRLRTIKTEKQGIR